jgi:hypothetical protein
MIWNGPQLILQLPQLICSPSPGFFETVGGSIAHGNIIRSTRQEVEQIQELDL